jgi:hypothetical protein
MLLSHASAENITKHWRRTVSLTADPGRVPCQPCHRLHDDISTCVKAPSDEAAACMADITVDRLIHSIVDAWSGVPI